MKRIQTLETRDLAKSLKTGGCGECQTSCQSACKTSCGLANQQCENANRCAKQSSEESCRLIVPDQAALFSFDGSETSYL